MQKSVLLARVCSASIALATGTFAISAQAQTAAAPSEPSTIIVTGQAQATTTPEVLPITTVYSESTITSDALRNQSEQASLQTMLASQPSVFTFQTGPNGVGANIYFRAFNSGQFAETFDGIAINDVFNGGVTGQASTFNSVLFIPANVDSVVLNRGINNPASNSYNSLGGTIDFLPRMPTATAGATAAASYGSFNSYTLQGSINTGDWNGLKQTLQVDYRKSDGWTPNTENNNLNIYYAGRYDTARGDEISLVAVFDQNRGHNPFDMPVPLLQANGGFYQYPTSVAYEQAKDTESMVILGFKAALSPVAVFENKFFVGTQDFLRTSYANPADSNAPYELPNQAADYNYWIYNPNGPYYNPKTLFGPKVNGVYPGNQYHFYGYTTLAAGYSPRVTLSLPSNTVIVGGNLTYGTLHSREYWYGSAPVPIIPGYDNAWDERDTRLLASVYVQDAITLLDKALTITPGVKYIYAHTKDTDAIGFFYPYGGSDGDSEHFVSPTIGVNYKATEHLAFNAAFGQNIKLPDISAYYNNVPGTTSSTPLTPPPVKIKPEHVNDYELGVRFEDGDFALSADIYREDFSSIFIDTFDPSTYETHVSNGGTARYQGAEVQLSEGLHTPKAGDFKAYVNFAYNQAKYTSNFETDSLGSSLSNAQYSVTKGERMADVPNVLLTVGGNWIYQGFRFDAQARYVGSQLTIDDVTGAPSAFSIPKYTIIDLGLSKTFPLGAGIGKSVKFSFNANNLFNKYYYAEAYTAANGSYVGDTEFAAPGAPRSFMGKVEVSF